MDLEKLVRQCLEPEDVQQQLKRDKKLFDLYKEAWTQKVIREDKSRTVTLFVLEKFMQRLGFIGSKRQPNVSDDAPKDMFLSYYSGYDLLFVVTFLYLGLCEEKSVHLPQIRNDRALPKKKKTTVLAVTMISWKSVKKQVIHMLILLEYVEFGMLLNHMSFQVISSTSLSLQKLLKTEMTMSLHFFKHEKNTSRSMKIAMSRLY